ncbi:hypothetical protein B0J13DRAFT_541621 [Dactylonectria estremocensis]|uniref:F-box domain-containing protein n=1 Tax=Dactylonectria estremocensis TaxID=1079267 RepID=A0A9P9FBI6_9HYPO|nr:hypothetical protein B0J13DRAFT_541621 [Dactylonectria estremocensis]
MSGAVAAGAGAGAINLNVFSTAQHQLGRRLLLPAASDGGPLQPATGGVIVFAGQKAYQITAWNPSFRRDKLPSESSFEAEAAEAEVEVEADAIVTTNWDLEGSDLEIDNDSEGESETSRDTTDSRPPSSVGMKVMSSSMSNADHIPRATASSASRASSASEDQLPRQDIKGKSLEVPRGCISIGKLAASSGSWTEQCDSGVLVELLDADASNTRDANTIAHDSPGGGLRVRVTKPGKISNVASSLVTIAAVAEHSAGCQLLTTPVLLTLKGQSKCRQVYQVLFDSHVFQNEDCGAAVLDPTSGEIFGQVVCGYPGTLSAYILPIEDLIQHVAARIMRSDITLSPPNEAPRARRRILTKIPYGSWKPAKHWRSSANTEPHDFVELGSPSYFKHLSGDEMPPRQRLRSLGETFRDSLTVIKQVRPKFPRHQGKTGQPRTDAIKANFFSLPAEICDIIINQLSFRCAMNFRRVSKACRAAVSINGPAISKRLLDKCPLPPLARLLYPNSLPDLTYVWEVGYRHAVASKLAGHLASWLGREMYLYKSRHQQQVFQEKRTLIQKRLLPPLFTAFHFFELYPQSLASVLRQTQKTQLGESTAHCKPIPYAYELEAMERYSNDVLMQTHDVMKCLVVFFRTIVSPPSYYGPTERFLRGYYQDKPDDTVLVTVLCLGGLGKVLQLAEIEDYSKRRGEVDKMYAALTKSRNGLSATALNSLHGESAAGRDVPSRSITGGSGDEKQCHLWQHLPSLDRVWRITAEDLIERRRLVQRPQGLRNYSQVLTELAKPASEVTAADRLYEEHQLWHGLSNHNFETVDG